MLTTPTMSRLNMTCPSGGSFYACETGTRFVGCCASNPCGSTGCSAGNLKPASFPTSQFGSMPDQQCEAGLFYTCATTNPPFWGCCKTNPCNAGSCGASSLSAAFLSSNPASAAPYLALNSNNNQSSASATGTSSNAATPNTNSSSAHQNNIGAIFGGVVGGLAVLAILVLGIILLLRRRKQHASHERDSLVPKIASVEHAHPYTDNSPNPGKTSPHINKYSPFIPYRAKAATPPPIYGFSHIPPPPQPANVAYELPAREISREYSELPRDTHHRSTID